MAQPNQPYSAREALAQAIRDYAEAVRRRSDREKAAAAAQQAANDQARKQRDYELGELQKVRTKATAYAQDQARNAGARQSAVETLLQQAGVLDAVQMNAGPTPAPPLAGAPLQELQRCATVIQNAQVAVGQEVQALDRYRGTWPARIRRALHLKP